MAKKSNPTNKRKGLRRLAPLHGSPSSIKLKSLLEKITPLPWSKSGGVLRNVVQGPVDGDWNKIYAAHSTKVLPQIVDELHSMLGDALKYPQLELCDHHKQRLVGIISRIEEVKMGNARADLPRIDDVARESGCEGNNRG